MNRRKERIADFRENVHIWIAHVATQVRLHSLLVVAEACSPFRGPVNVYRLGTAAHHLFQYGCYELRSLLVDEDEPRLSVKD